MIDLYKKCYELTPITRNEGCYYKGEDLFRPFEDSPINGTKLRQCIWLIKNLTMTKTGVISAASVRSPQLPMVARVAKAFGKTCRLVIGSSNLETAKRENKMVALADTYGVEWIQSKCAYNSALQAAAKKSKFNNEFMLEYGISTTHPDFWLEFYSFGGRQVKNIPQEVNTIIMTAGSCNSILSVMIGLWNERRLHKFKFKLIGVGPSKYQMLKARFEYATKDSLPEDQIEYIGLHEMKVYKYEDKQPFEYDGITFHPTYEGKMMKWLSDNRPELLASRNNLIWIVGSEPCIRKKRLIIDDEI